MSNAQPRPGLPANAQLVFKGVIFEVWQWEQEMFDGTKETFERIWRSPTVEVIAAVGDKILIEEQSQPDRKNIISLASGRADQGEDVMAEAKRELLEETGYASDD
jgi:ADP-ribose pyrophosphatase